MKLPKISIARTIAEFTVIVIGVLVALGFESWREDVADRALELEYLERLKNDFHEDSLRIRLVDFYSWLSVAIVAAPGLADRMPYRDIVRGEISPRLQEAIRG